MKKAHRNGVPFFILSSETDIQTCPKTNVDHTGRPGRLYRVFYFTKFMKLSLFVGFFTILSLVCYGQNPQGFFLNDFQPRTAEIPSSVNVAKPTVPATAIVNVDVSQQITPVSKYLFGNNANIFMTQMVDQPDLLDRITELSPNVIRFPGGNLSSLYFWNAANKDQLPADVPANLVNADGTPAFGSDYNGYWYGGNTGSWTATVDNYYGMLNATGSTGIITINYSYARYSTAPDPVAAAAHLAADWVRHDNGRTKFWEIGNESNGNWQAGWRINTANNHDGQPQIITGAVYGDHFNVFVDSMRAAAAETGATIYIGAQLLAEAPASWWTDTDINWNTGVFQHAKDNPDFYIIHSYYTPYNTNSSAAEILASAATVTKSMIDYVTSSVTTAGRVQKPLALTEWNIFAVGSKQMVSHVSGMHAALVLGELIKNKYAMASRWDLANGYENGNDHGMFSQGDEPEGIPKWNPRPVFYHMYYFQKYFGDHMVSSTVSGSNDIVTYASTFDSGEAGIVVINKGTVAQTVKINLGNYGYGEKFYWYSLTGGPDNGEFSRKVLVNGKTTTLASGGPSNIETIQANASTIGGGVQLSVPARSAQYILIEHGDNTIMGTEESMNLPKIYPNPSSGKFRIDLYSSGFSTIHITDLQDKQLYTADVSPSANVLEVNTTLSPGLYFVRLERAAGVKVMKLVIE